MVSRRRRVGVQSGHGIGTGRGVRVRDLSKFDWIMDDKPASEFLPEKNRIYRHPFNPLNDKEDEVDDFV